MRQIIEGVQYMHEKLVMHLDMKPENILCVTRTGNRIKLIDFGLARRYDPARTLQVMFGTPDFAAPEVLSYERVTPAADMWSVGVICYVLLSGLSPFMGNTDLETMTNVTKAIYDFDDESFDPISEEAKDFIAKLLVKDAARRLKPADCLQHKWLAKTPAKKGKAQQLNKTKLKKYVVRRRWQKAVTAIMALSRMGANLSLTGAARSPVAVSANRKTTKTSSVSTARTGTGAGTGAKGQRTTTTKKTSSLVVGPAGSPTANRTSTTTTSSSSSSTSYSTRTVAQTTPTSPQKTTSTISSNSNTSTSLLASRFGASSSPTFTTPTSRGAGSTSQSTTSYRVQSSALSTSRRKL